MCDCITKVNELLHEQDRGVRLCSTINLTTGVTHVAITTEAVAGRKKPKGYHLVPSYCPFCGIKYSEEKIKNDNSG